MAQNPRKSGSSAKSVSGDTCARAAPIVHDTPLISHDLQSALTDVVNGLHLVDLDKLDPQTRMHIERARSSLARVVAGS